MKPGVGIMFASVIEPAQLHLTKYFASKFFHRLVIEHGNCEFSVRFADGANLASTPRSNFTLVINDPGVLAKILDCPDELTLGEAFMAASARAFRAGRIHLYQMLLRKPDPAADRLESRKNNGLSEQKSIRSFQ